MKHAFLVVFLFLFLNGCYTVLKHPPVQDPENPEYSYLIDYSDNCADCHANRAPIMSPARQTLLLPRTNYIYENQRWEYFYQFPWWTRPMFSGAATAGSGGSGSQALPTTSARRRFPGAGGSGSPPSGGIITGGGSGGTVVGKTGQSGKSGSSSGTNIRQKAKGASGRSAIRGSGKKGQSSDNGKKVNRRKKK